MANLGKIPGAAKVDRKWTSNQAARRMLYVASVAHLLLLSRVGDVYAAGAYDGQWNGSATVTAGRCRPGSVALTVVGKVVVGEARFDVEALSIHGTVSEDGAFGATMGFHHFTGQFNQDMLEGTFDYSNCAWKVVLKRTN
jgi:hypothetical protein